MPTQAPRQVPEKSYDDGAVSITVSDRLASDPRPGTFFDKDFSAVSPVYFHDLGSGKYIGIFSHRWHSGETSSSDPNMFSSYETDAVPSWCVFDGRHGSKSFMSGNSINITTRITSDSRTVVGACSRSSNYLYVLQSCSAGGTNFGVVSHHFCNPVTGEVTLLGEEVISNVSVGGETVVFDRGIVIDSNHLTFAGRDSAGKIYLARKSWGYVGKSAAQIDYQSDGGWFSDPSRSVPLKSSSGSHLSSSGPISFAEHRGNMWMSVVQSDSGMMTAQIYGSAGFLSPWYEQGRPFPLGQSGSSWLGGTVHFQNMLRGNRSRLSDLHVAGIPVVYAIKKTSGDEHGISIFWDLWPVTSVSASAGAVLSAEAYALSS